MLMVKEKEMKQKKKERDYSIWLNFGIRFKIKVCNLFNIFNKILMFLYNCSILPLEKLIDDNFWSLLTEKRSRRCNLS